MRAKTQPMNTADAEESAAFSLPGAGSIDLSGRVRLAAPGVVAAPRALEDPTPPIASARPLELEFDRTELAGPSQAPASMPPLPSIALRSNAFSVVLRVALILAAIIAAVAVARFWRARQAQPTVVRLTIESHPTGAEIWLDGLPTGKYTPSVLDWDNQIAHVVLLKAEGRAQTRQTVPAGQTEGVIPIELAAVGYVQITSTPPGAKIATGTEDLGIAPRSIELAADTPTKLTATLDGYLDAATTLTVTAGATLTWAPALAPAGRLDISSDPADARIRLDGQVVGRTPLVVTVAAGVSHVVQLEAAGLDPYKRNVTVERGAMKPIVGHLADREERRLQASLASVNHQIEDLERQLRALEANQSTEYFAAMANMKKRTAAETKLDKLTKRKEDVEGQIDAHRTELEDRTSK
jgi:PEGA domain